MGETESADIRFFHLTSRIGRMRYLAYGIGLTLLAFVPGFIGGMLLAVSGALGMAILGLTYIGILVLSIGFVVRRLHDLDKSGWWTLLMIVPLVNLGLLIYLIFFPGTIGENRFGEAPPPNSGWVILGTVAYIAIIPVGIIAALAIPTFMGYKMTAQMAEGVALAGGAEKAVAQYVQDNKGNWPANLASIYPAAQQNPAGQYVATVTAVTAPDGSAYGIISTMKTEGVNSMIAGTAVEVWTQNGIVWYCGPASVNPVDARYLPTGCHESNPPPP